jgi:TonB family protein
MLIGATVVVIEKRVFPHPKEPLVESPLAEIEILSIARTHEPYDAGIGKNGNGLVGVNKDRGEGSHTHPQRSGGGGSGGNHDRLPAQIGKLPMPSAILAAIPKTEPLKAPSLPAAGIDFDPSLWRDLKLPHYGDPLSKSDVASNGPGVDGGMGTRRGTGVGDGDGDGFGPGKNGNTGGGENQRGCCGPGASSGNVPDGWERRVFRVTEVEQRARLLAKPEPQYTEDARRNQATGTVVLRVVFASNGEVTQIQAVQPLPFGLTERAIAAARQIKFIPASKNGHPVSVHMQLEYNFNLY